MVLVHLPFSQYFYGYMKFQQIPGIVLELCPEQENLIKENTSNSKQGRGMVLVHCTSS